MITEINDLMDLLSRQNRRLVLALQAGGIRVVDWLRRSPGSASRLLEVVAPCSAESLCSYLGASAAPVEAFALVTLLAERAWERASWLAAGAEGIGVGGVVGPSAPGTPCATRVVQVCACTDRALYLLSLSCRGDELESDREEEIVSRLVLQALAWACNLEVCLPLPLVPGEELVRQELVRQGPMTDLLLGRTKVLCLEQDGRLRRQTELPGGLVAGSFHPLHRGHLGMAAVARTCIQGRVDFELSVINADKPALAEAEVRRRGAAFVEVGRLWLTRAAMFAEKAELFPGVCFVVGADTAARIVQARFYGGEEGLQQAMNIIRERKCRFLVAGRLQGESFLTLGQLALPAEFADLFEAIPEESFRLDISSTAIRQGRS